MFGVRVEGKTAPGPVLRMFHQFPFQRVHVHVVKFFASLLQTPHIEIAGGTAFDLPGGRSFVFFEGAEGLTFLLRFFNSPEGVNPDRALFE